MEGKQDRHGETDDRIRLISKAAPQNNRRPCTKYLDWSTAHKPGHHQSKCSVVVNNPRDDGADSFNRQERPFFPDVAPGMTVTVRHDLLTGEAQLKTSSRNEAFRMRGNALIRQCRSLENRLSRDENTDDHEAGSLLRPGLGSCNTGRG